MPSNPNPKNTLVVFFAFGVCLFLIVVPAIIALQGYHLQIQGVHELHVINEAGYTLINAEQEFDALVIAVLRREQTDDHFNRLRSALESFENSGHAGDLFEQYARMREEIETYYERCRRREELEKRQTALFVQYVEANNKGMGLLGELRKQLDEAGEKQTKVIEEQPYLPKFRVELEKRVATFVDEWNRRRILVLSVHRNDNPKDLQPLEDAIRNMHAALRQNLDELKRTITTAEASQRLEEIIKESVTTEKIIAEIIQNTADRFAVESEGANLEQIVREGFIKLRENVGLRHNHFFEVVSLSGRAWRTSILLAAVIAAVLCLFVGTVTVFLIRVKIPRNEETVCQAEPFSALPRSSDGEIRDLQPVADKLQEAVDLLRRM
ncbi:MAG TPA: hypothetical protein DEB39_10305 [Planctomycetaceae bacterium]|nr:hypothetical protein [Planctomycetaceae bacterium]